ncbi:hypothetical protein [Pseudochelatococcus contaminans]|uniref:Uncharacterized protein n=1 Tax=Pseudochelatococcus contaminans TaxID=1538103 RepID=A0A7W6EIR8_9HYPH|nr:hypothetical protein [Pseudochelatococcus contaminans]MBB3811368.1 hypothetical protein [Pseudochelatococcus contaminans]
MNRSGAIDVSEMDYPPGWEPIGFSDLEPDESRLISLFRNWRHGAPTDAIATHMLAISLTSMNYHHYTEIFLNLFKSIDCYLSSHPDWIVYPLLAPEEETLIASAAGSVGESVPLSIRPPEAITRSGRDRLEMAIARSYRAVYGQLR